MTRHVIYEHYHGGKWYMKIICRFTCHVWTKIIDIKIGETETHEVSLCIWKCVDCGILQLWILKEHKLEAGR